MVPGGPCGLDFLGWFQFSTSVGASTLRLTDLPYLALVGSLLFVSVRSSAQRANVGQRPLALLLLVFGLSLIPVLVIDVDRFSVPCKLGTTGRDLHDRLAHAVCGQAPLGCAFHHGDGGRCVRYRARTGCDHRWPGQLSGRLVGGNGPDTEVCWQWS